MTAQHYKNHRMLVPAFHFFVLPVFGLNFGYSLYRLKQTSSSFDSIVGVLVAAALLMGVLYSRLFALRVQDRVIRLEMQLRLERILPSDLKSRIHEFALGQLIALRFASDAELPELARLVLAQKLTGRNAIKQSIQNWQADVLRA
ncbi:MAG TPA: DUF6526 family protein [Candidatus Dormibacteraeota bacterium]|nr:DUF6526 family protein [Candidatus Dormibacteraeota bacterium]